MKHTSTLALSGVATASTTPKPSCYVAIVVAEIIESDCVGDACILRKGDRHSDATVVLHYDPKRFE